MATDHIGAKCRSGFHFVCKLRAGQKGKADTTTRNRRPERANHRRVQACRNSSNPNIITARTDKHSRHLTKGHWKQGVTANRLVEPQASVEGWTPYRAKAWFDDVAERIARRCPSSSGHEDVETSPFRSTKGVESDNGIKEYEQNIMYCPYCGITHDETIVASIEHVLPYALGGSNDLTITACKWSNNTLGSDVDAPFMDFFPVRSDRFFFGLKS